MINEYIGTYTNKRFYFLEPEPDQVCIEDIAHALSMTCRYSGHVKRFYSVAEHSIIVARLVYAKTGCNKQALSALLHDASEAYITDVPRPLKPYLTNYGNIERLIEKAIQLKFGVMPMNELIRYIDTNIVGSEVKQLFSVAPGFANDYDQIDIPKVGIMSPSFAKSKFLTYFKSYNGDHSDVMSGKNWRYLT